MNFLASMARTPGLDSTDRLLAVTTLCFDISILELFLPLTVGAYDGDRAERILRRMAWPWRGI